MRSSIELRYVGSNPDDTSDIDLGVLGESISGFDKLFKDLFALSRIEGELDVRVGKIENGSIVFCVGIYVARIALENLSRAELTDFIRVAYPTAVVFLHDSLLEVGNLHQVLNALAAKYPFDTFLAGYFLSMLTASKSAKQAKWQSDIPKRYQGGLQKVVNGGKYRKALKPFVEGAVNEIVIGSRAISQSVTIREDDFGDYLGDDQQILPDLVNGTTHNLVGELLGIQSVKGDSLTFRIDISDTHTTLIAYPISGTKTEDYLKYYHCRCNIQVEIYRKSLYQKPKLLLRSIDLEQTTLFDE